MYVLGTFDLEFIASIPLFISNSGSGGINLILDSEIVVVIPCGPIDTETEFIVDLNAGICKPYKVLEEEDGLSDCSLYSPLKPFKTSISAKDPLWLERLK